MIMKPITLNSINVDSTLFLKSISVNLDKIYLLRKYNFKKEQEPRAHVARDEVGRANISQCYRGDVFFWRLP